MAKKKKASQNEPVANTAEPSKMDGSISNDELARQVIEGVRSARLTAEELRGLRERFRNLKKTEDILGYHHSEWEKFCKEKLGMTAQTARRWIKQTCDAIGVPTPGSKHDGSKNRKYSHGVAPWFHTADGTVVDVARSAAQKAVRDGDEVAGCYWMRQLFFVGYDVWKALIIFAVEDVGIADLSVRDHVLGLMQAADRCKPKDHRPDLQCVKDACKNHPDLLCVIEAMQICCRAQKCRAADDAAIWLRENPTYKPPTPEETAALNRDDLAKPVIDDKVIDQHTANGRRRKRGMDHFKQVASQLKNKSNVIPFTPPNDRLCPHCGGTGRLAA
ncbi:MAG: hypothetical protein WCF42_17630 [Terriglobales bacterium]